MNDTDTWRGIPLHFLNSVPDRYDPDRDDWFVDYIVDLNRIDDTTVSLEVTDVTDDLIVGQFYDEEIENVRYEEQWRIEQPLHEIASIDVP